MCAFYKPIIFDMYTYFVIWICGVFVFHVDKAARLITRLLFGFDKLSSSKHFCWYSIFVFPKWLHILKFELSSGGEGGYVGDTVPITGLQIPRAPAMLTRGCLDTNHIIYL